MSCSTIPDPIEANVTYPHTFTDVGYLEQYSALLFGHVADLIVDQTKLVYTNKKDVNVEILFDVIEDISYGQMAVTDPNHFVVISYSKGTTKKTALFTAFRYAGWVGGSSEIHRVILHAYRQYKAKETRFPAKG